MKTLSPKQQQIYDYIVSFSGLHGYPPSVREIGEYVGLKSPSSGPHPGAPEPAGEEPDQVPVVGSVAAGAPILAQECIEDYLTFDTGGLTGEHFALRVRGESMRYAGILPGDLVVVHQQQDARSGEIVVALFEDEATVKTLRRRDGHTWLMPENPDYEPIDGDGCTILGKVVAVVRRY